MAGQNESEATKMALRQLMIHKRMAAINVLLLALRTTAEDILTRSLAMKTREEALEAAVMEISDTSTPEEQTAVDEAVAAFEADQAAIVTEQTENDAAKVKLEEEIQTLQAELDEIDKRAATPPPVTRGAEKKEIGGEVRMRRNGFFKGMTGEQRSAFLANDEVKAFLARAREFKGQVRAVTGAELFIPEIALELLRDNLHRYSKLIDRVRVKALKGTARQHIAGTIPEGIWMEAIANLNELALSFNEVEVDGYKVGGFIPIANSTLEDSDLNMANEIFDALGQAIGYAVDKAILFGTGVKMPIGIATRLAQAAQPSTWGTNAPAWTDLRTSRLLKFDPAGMTPEVFFATLLLKLSTARANYTSGQKFWAMNTATWNMLLSKTVQFNAAGALVAAQNMTMPIVGGTVDLLEFMADNDIIGGYGEIYLLVERAGANLASSEHVRFISDQTVFKGTARYDGTPVFGESFVMVNIANVAPTTSVTFAGDVANTVATPKALPIAGAYTGAQSVDLTCDTAGALIYYTVDGSTPTAAKTLYNGPVAVAASKTIKAIAIKAGMTDSEILSAAYVIS
jgi:HK97 family phage major capsid protein